LIASVILVVTLAIYAISWAALAAIVISILAPIIFFTTVKAKDTAKSED